MFNTVVFEIFAHEEDVTKIVSKIQDIVNNGEFATLSVGNCGWANAPDCWWIRIKVTVEERIQIVDWICEESGVELYNPALIY